MVVTRARRWALAAVALAVAGCAHVGVNALDDPVQEARLRLDEVAHAKGDVVCAAEEVQGDRMLYAAYTVDDLYQYLIISPVLVSRSRASRAERARAAAQYARIWTEYLTAPEGAEERDALLDWLTTRSMGDLAMLRDYHRDFGRALRKGCG